MSILNLSKSSIARTLCPVYSFHKSVELLLWNPARYRSIELTSLPSSLVATPLKNFVSRRTTALSAKHLLLICWFWPRGIRFQSAQCCLVVPVRHCPGLWCVDVQALTVMVLLFSFNQTGFFSRKQTTFMYCCVCCCRHYYLFCWFSFLHLYMSRYRRENNPRVMTNDCFFRGWMYRKIKLMKTALWNLSYVPFITGRLFIWDNRALERFCIKYNKFHVSPVIRCGSD